MDIPICRRCKRPLNDYESIRIGLGPKCRVLNPGGPAQTNDVLDQFLLEPPLRERLVLCRHAWGNENRGSIWTNVPHYAVQHSATGYEWGYGGSGPADLALNLAEAVIRIAGLNGMMKSRMWIGEISGLAWDIHHDLKADFIAYVPFEGIELPFAELLGIVQPLADVVLRSAYQDVGAMYA